MHSCPSTIDISSATDKSINAKRLSRMIFNHALILAMFLLLSHLPEQLVVIEHSDLIEDVVLMRSIDMLSHAFISRAFRVVLSLTRSFLLRSCSCEFVN